MAPCGLCTGTPDQVGKRGLGRLYVRSREISRTRPYLVEGGIRARDGEQGAAEGSGSKMTEMESLVRRRVHGGYKRAQRRPVPRAQGEDASVAGPFPRRS